MSSISDATFRRMGGGDVSKNRDVTEVLTQRVMIPCRAGWTSQSILRLSIRVGKAGLS